MVSVGTLREGHGFQIIELNGVTSEAGHIYDPANSVGFAWKTLMEQWTLAFEIGAANAAAGASVSTVGGLMRDWWRYRRESRGKHMPM